MGYQVNGVVLREDFKTAVKIFNNAFNLFYQRKLLG